MIFVAYAPLFLVDLFIAHFLYSAAVDDGNYLRALQFLEGLKLTKETQSMWMTLAGLTLQEGHLKMAERLESERERDRETERERQRQREIIYLLQMLCCCW